MLDGITTASMQRSHGLARVGFAMSGTRARLTDLHQSGSAKAMLPRVDGSVPEVVFLNTSGGLTGGDRLAYAIAVGDHTSVTATTQTAERAYQSGGSPANAIVEATVGAGGHLSWLPQETILFEDSDLDRHTQIDLAPDASCLLTETIILGRRAMGEAPRRAQLRDRRMLRRAGQPVWAESLRIDRNFLNGSTSPALFGSACAFAVVALVASGAADAVAPLRQVLNEPGCTAEASGWDGKCILRILATDGWPLRRQLIRALSVLHAGPLPRVWQYHGAIA